MRAVVAGLILLSCIPAEAQGPALTPSVAALESRVVSHRRAIRSGIFELESSVEFLSGRLAGQTRVKKATIYMDGARIRTDYVKSYGVHVPGSVSGSEHRESWSRDGDVTRFYNNYNAAGATISPAQYRTEQVHASMHTFPDPRLIGLWPDTFLNLTYVSFTSLFGNEKWHHDEPPSSSQVNGVACTKVTYRQRSSGPSGETLVADVYLDEKRDWNVIRMAIRYGNSNDEIDCKLKQFDGVGWFPSVVSYTQKRNDKVMQRELLRIVALRRINEPLKADIFQFSGMGVPPGTVIHDHTGKEVREAMLTKGGLAPVQPSSNRVPADIKVNVEGKAWGWRRTILVINVIVVAIVAIVVLWKRFRPAKT